MIEYVVIGFLMFLLLAQQWDRHILLNKLMSRDYQNYIETRKNLKAKPTLQRPPPMDETIDPASERQAQELNSILGIA